MAAAKPPVTETAVNAWSDAFRALNAMPSVAGVAFGIVLAMVAVTFALAPNPGDFAHSAWMQVYSIISSVVGAALLAPLAIAMHRFVLLGETTNRYPFEPSSQRFQRFVGFAIVVKLLWLAPNLIQTAAALVGGGWVSVLLAGLASLALTVAVAIITLRRVILFPAIAVDAPGAAWSQAGSDTKGSSWRVLFIFLLTALPVAIVGLALYWLFLSPGLQTSTMDRLIFSTLSALVEVPTLAAFAAAASHIYRFRADALTKPGLPGAQWQTG